ETVHRLKTGALIRASVLLGALGGAEAGDARLTLLSDYADCIGLAFQIQDDVLGVVGDRATLGKTPGLDQRHAKPTYPTLLGLDQAQLRAEALVEQACGHLQTLGAGAETLRQLARYIVQRDR
ncbi:MAG: polyprenyl synthetase family protein, partial [Candidatus Competibacterales bacterium]|nr:polyprenyl synthetase family protein [Candidatus Competibacterales bacterium]